MKQRSLFPACFWVKVRAVAVMYQRAARLIWCAKSTPTCKSPFRTDERISNLSHKTGTELSVVKCIMLQITLLSNFSLKLITVQKYFRSHSSELDDQVDANLYYLQAGTAAHPWQNYHKVSTRTNDWETKYDNRNKTIIINARNISFCIAKGKKRKARNYKT